ncbi:hypothetical protein ACP70R_005457 [Stipagrostis hirtigluma subsp. patula]
MRLSLGLSHGCGPWHRTPPVQVVPPNASKMRAPAMLRCPAAAPALAVLLLATASPDAIAFAVGSSSQSRRRRLCCATPAAGDTRGRRGHCILQIPTTVGGSGRGPVHPVVCIFHAPTATNVAFHIATEPYGTELLCYDSNGEEI